MKGDSRTVASQPDTPETKEEGGQAEQGGQEEQTEEVGQEEKGEK